ASSPIDRNASTMRSSSSSIDVLLSEQLTEAGKSPVGPRLHRPRRHAQHRGGLGFAETLVEAQRHHGPLIDRQRPERVADRVVIADLRRDLPPAASIAPLAGGPPPLPPPPPAP